LAADLLAICSIVAEGDSRDEMTSMRCGHYDEIEFGGLPGLHRIALRSKGSRLSRKAKDHVTVVVKAE
jgi:hypothetical protein